MCVDPEWALAWITCVVNGVDGDTTGIVVGLMVVLPATPMGLWAAQLSPAAPARPATGGADENKPQDTVPPEGTENTSRQAADTDSADTEPPGVRGHRHRPDLIYCGAMNADLAVVPPTYHDLLTAPNTAVLSTLSPDGSPQNTPVWFWFDGTSIHVSTVKERQKYRNLHRDRRLAFTIVDPAQPQRYIEIRGTAEFQDDPAGEMRDRIASLYGYPDGSVFDPPGAVRVTVTIRPTRVNAR